VQVAHTCNPSYSGDRDQEDHGPKPAWKVEWREALSSNQKKKIPQEELDPAEAWKRKRSGCPFLYCCSHPSATVNMFSGSR
jgi:hypothetical protein